MGWGGWCECCCGDMVLANATTTALLLLLNATTTQLLVPLNATTTTTPAGLETPASLDDGGHWQISPWILAGVCIGVLVGLTCFSLAAGWWRVGLLERRVLVATFTSSVAEPWGGGAASAPLAVVRRRSSESQQGGGAAAV